MKQFMLAAIIAFTASISGADAESCDRTLAAMRKFEIQNRDEVRSALDTTFAGLAAHDVCNPKYLEAQDRVDAYYLKLAVFAKAFVEACRDDATKANDVFLYSLPEIQSAVPSSIRQTCESLKK
jgi:hypothetical protein